MKWEGADVGKVIQHKRTLEYAIIKAISNPDVGVILARVTNGKRKGRLIEINKSALSEWVRK